MPPPWLDLLLCAVCVAVSLWDSRRARRGHPGAARWSWIALAGAVGFGAFGLAGLLPG